MKRLVKKSDYLLEVRKNYENVDNHEDTKENNEELEVKHPDTSNEKDKSLYSFN